MGRVRLEYAGNVTVKVARSDDAPSRIEVMCAQGWTVIRDCWGRMTEKGRNWVKSSQGQTVGRAIRQGQTDVKRLSTQGALFLYWHVGPRSQITVRFVRKSGSKRVWCEKMAR